MNERFRMIGAELVPEDKPVPAKPVAVQNAANVVVLTPDMLDNLSRVIRQRYGAGSETSYERQAALELKIYYEACGMNRDVIHDYQSRMKAFADGIVGPRTIARARELGVEIILRPDWNLTRIQQGRWRR